MEDRFDRFIEIILRSEGGYVNDPDDLGGETKYGITKRRYPDEDIKNLSMERAKFLWNRDFFQPLNLHYIESDLLALHVFDMGVNANKKVAVQLLQQLLNGCQADGTLGPVTAEALSYAMVTTKMIEAYKAKRIEYYEMISRRRNNAKFLRGWVNRVNNTKL